MRKFLFVTLALTLALPELALADWGNARRRGPRKGRSSAGYVVRDAPGSASPASRFLTPAPGRVSPARPAPRVGYGTSAFVLGVDPIPFWMGWGWGWGYYPLWPRPYYPGEEPGYQPDDAQRISARLEAYGAGASNAAVGTLALSMEGPMAGFSADVSGLAIAGAPGTTTGDSSLGLGGARASWTVMSDAAFRLRLELGASMLSVPDSGVYAGSAYANTMRFGPQLGVSGNLGLVGPFGLEGYARVTPLPVPVLDTRAAFVIRGGSLAVSAGWRVIDVNGDGVDSPEAHFAGPELGLQVMF